ncbi:uncharacterized protein LOC132639720 [Lycium barbarum]|uniref:uncharacterized protein LOC132639720 n=1 Tax=Lycium barbarum TaxID=112863 RepID=UPI00293E5600|nr:uncharacterized protein LOC132639720 [Lycium barbarum]
MGTLTGGVASLKRLDQIVAQLKEHVEGTRIETSPVINVVETSRERVSRDKQVVDDEHRDRNNTNYQNYPGISRYSKVDFPRFSGDDLKSWLFKVEQFFNFDNIAMDKRVGLAAIHLEGEPIKWHQSFMRADYNDPMEEIKKIRQTGSVKDYQAMFEIDTGSSHNFIDPDMVKQLGCSTRVTTPHQVSAANKNDMRVDKICEITWLLQGAEFTAEEKKHLLRGAGKQVVTSGAGKIDKVSGNGSQLCMIQVVPAMFYELHGHALKTIQESVEESRLTELLKEFKCLFDEPTQLPPFRGVFDHRIVLHSGTEPINKRPYRYPSVKKDIIEGLVKQMLDQEDLLDELGGSKIFSKIDLRSGYHQLRMAVDDIPKIAFRTHFGHYEYLVMPFGLSNAPAIFQGLMNTVFQAFLRKYVLVFFDDILIYNQNLEDQLLHLTYAFVEMQKHQLFAKQSKCFFGVQKIEYLGHFISEEGVSTDPQKISAVKNWPIPTTLKQLRGFLGLSSYYRSFSWSSEATKAFEELKLALIQVRVLALPDMNKTFIVETDASGYGIRVVLMQEGHPIAFISKILSSKHVAMSVYDRELLAIVHAVTKCSQYLLGQKFIIRTDRALKFLMEQKIHTNSQLMWLTKLMPFDYTIEYKKGSNNKAADALSKVTGSEILALAGSELLQATAQSWETDPEIKAILIVEKERQISGGQSHSVETRHYRILACFSKWWSFRSGSHLNKVIDIILLEEHERGCQEVCEMLCYLSKEQV